MSSVFRICPSSGTTANKLASSVSWFFKFWKFIAQVGLPQRQSQKKLGSTVVICKFISLASFSKEERGYCTCPKIQVPSFQIALVPWAAATHPGPRLYLSGPHFPFWTTERRFRKESHPYTLYFWGSVWRYKCRKQDGAPDLWDGGGKDRGKRVDVDPSWRGQGWALDKWGGLALESHFIPWLPWWLRR